MQNKSWMWVIWPAFMVAAALEMMVFAVLDPETLTLFGHQIEWSRTTVYAVSFFIFWLMFMLSSSLTVLLSKKSHELNAV